MIEPQSSCSFNERFVEPQGLLDLPPPASIELLKVLSAEEQVVRRFCT